MPTSAEEHYKVRENNRIKPEEGETVMVRAIQFGIYKFPRNPVDEKTGNPLPPFEIPVKLYSANWMIPADEAAKAKIDAWLVEKARLAQDVARKARAANRAAILESMETGPVAEPEPVKVERPSRKK